MMGMNIEDYSLVGEKQGALKGREEAKGFPCTIWVGRTAQGPDSSHERTLRRPSLCVQVSSHASLS